MVVNSMYKNLGLAALVITALIGCGDDPVPSDCPAGQIKAQVGGVEECYTSCTVSTDCAATERCSATTGTGVCLPRTTTPVDMGNDMTVVTPTDMGDMSVTPTDMPVTPVDMPDMAPDMPVGDPDVKICMDAADKLFKSCVQSQCGAAITPATQMQFDAEYNAFLNGANTPQGMVAPCIQSIKQNPQFRTSITNIAGASVTCAAIKDQLYCDPESFDLGDECACPVRMPPTNLGAACSDGEMTTTCNAGSLEPFCTSDDPADPGECWAVGCQLGMNPMPNSIFFGTGTGCGDVKDGGCAAFQTMQGIIGVCIETCRQDSDCAQAPATGCSLFPDGMGGLAMIGGAPAGQCIPKCATNADCVTQDNAGNPVQGMCGADNFCDFP